MKINDYRVDEVDDHDRAVLQSTLSIINNILLRNNLNMRGAVLDDCDAIAIDSQDTYDDLAAGRSFVRTREKKGSGK